MPPRCWRRRGRLADTIAEACRAVLCSAEPREKVVAARRAARDWRLGRLRHDFDTAMPDRPARPAEPELRLPRDMPKRGSAGSLRSLIALIHALAHIEFSAIDLAFDLVGRFGAGMPRDFVDDWVRVGAEEAMHFALLDRRLRGLGSHYGALPAHDGLWEAAHVTRGDLTARLAVVPMVLEARGLDVTPQTIARLERAGETVSARILKRILNDEIKHVEAGTRWFYHAVNLQGLDPAETFHSLVSRHFRGAVKPPFNDSARRQAGLTREFYAPLAV
jgi:uncharacterized ferritin-like protein (DUF455 family)